jgi:glycosyltransferase involved in cell wall biosynthesis
VPPDERAVGPGPLLRLLVVARLGDHKLVSKLEPILAIPEVGEVTLVRRTPLALAGLRNLCPPAWLDRLGPLGEGLAEVWRLFAVLRECAGPRRPAYVVAFYLVPHGLYADLARRLFGVPTILLTLNELDIENAFRWAPLRHALWKATMVGIRGDNTRRRLVAAGFPPQRLFDPPNVYVPPPAEAGSFAPAESLDVVYVGPLVEVKRVDRLLRALAGVRARRPALRAALIGTGEEGARLEALSAELGLADAVQFVGWCPPDDVVGWLRRARLFVMTSEFEGLPMAMIEALSCGVPVVVPDTGDVTTVARDGDNAWVVRSSAPEAYAEAIGALLADEPRRQRLAEGARAARARFARDYSMDSARQAWRAALAGQERAPQ